MESLDYSNVSGKGDTTCKHQDSWTGVDSYGDDEVLSSDPTMDMYIRHGEWNRL